MKAKTAPFAQPENLYELMEMTAEAIELLPKNYYQDSFSMHAKDVPSDTETCNNDEGDLTARGKRLSKKACGTAFCRAGWMMAILDPKLGKMNPDSIDDHEEIYKPAMNLLTDAGCDAGVVGHLFGGGSGINGERWGTKAYAKAGAKGVRDFMEQYKTELKAARLTKNSAGRYSVSVSDAA